MVYLIIELGEIVGWVGDVKFILRYKLKIVVVYVLVGQYFGMRFVYFEVGSGVFQLVLFEMIGFVKCVIDVLLIVGGGIRMEEQVRVVVKVGVDIIVMGIVIEKVGFVEKVREKLEELNRGVKGQFFFFFLVFLSFVYYLEVYVKLEQKML